MPRPKSEKTERKCLICGGTTNVAHLGLDLCRACTVFYRRSRDRKFACRSNSNNCPIGEGVNCRKCRLREMERMLAEHPSKQKYLGIFKEEAHSPKQELASPVQDHHSPGQASTSSASPMCCPSVPPPLQSLEPKDRRPLLAKLRQAYRSMCETRLAGELAFRKDAPHPLTVVDGQFPIIPATYGGLETAHRLFLTALLQFGATCFPDFSDFAGKDRWTIVTNFFTRYRMFESQYRADKAFPDDMNKTFAGYTQYFSPDISDHFFDDCTHERANRAEAKRLMEEKFKRDLPIGRVSMRRSNISHEEFLAVLSLMFWATEGLDVTEEATRATQVYKEKILKELHVYYREELGMDDYAARLGEMLMLLQVHEQRAVAVDQHFEVLRLLNVFTDDTLVYRLT